MDEEYLKYCIENEVESTYFDFKKDIYNFSIPKNKQDFLVDIISLANSHADGDKYIITGVKLYPNGKRDLKGITEILIKDGADYQSLIDDNIEPNIILDFKIVNHLGNKYGVFKVSKENMDKPYLLSKQYGELPKGFIKVRKGQKNEYITRRDFDLYFNNKLNKDVSEITIKGIINEKISDSFLGKLYKCTVDFEDIKKKIYDAFVQIYNYELHKSTNTGFSLGDKIELEDDDIENIKKYAVNNDMPITDDFFDIGNLKYWSVVPNMGGQYRGSESEEEKYKLIRNLEKMTGIYNGLSEFKEEIVKIYYVELLIENSGKKFDEDIEVTLKINKDDFFEFENFPIPNEFIIEEAIDNKTLDSLLMNLKNSSVNSYTSKEGVNEPEKPSSYKIPGTIGFFKPEYSSYVDHYLDCIKYIANYEIIKDEKYFYIKFNQKSIKPNEKIFLPSRILLKNIPDFIEYEVISKYNPNIQKGKISSFKEENN